MGYLLMVFSGLLIIIPLRNPDLFFLAWIAIIPALYALKDQELKKGFWQGSILGFTIMAGTIYWLYYPLINFSGLPFIVVIFILLILFFLVGIFYGLWSVVFLLTNGRGKLHPIILAVSWVGFEYLRYLILSPIPFAFMGYTQEGFNYILQIADLGGVFLVSFVVILLNAYLFKIVKNRRLRYLIPVLFLLVLTLFYGNYRINQYQDLAAKANTLKIGIVNTSIPQQEKWLPSRIDENIDNIIEGTTGFKDVKLIITPETSMTFDLVRNEYYRNILMEKLKELNSDILVGSQSRLGEEEGKYNSSFLLNPEGKVLVRYNKNKLVLFGEKIPLPEIVRKLTGLEIGSLNNGQELSIFKTDYASWNTLICSEILYPLLIKDNITAIDFIINQSNEAWFGNSTIHQQIWTASIYRAIEYRRAVVRSGNYTYSGLIMPSGLYQGYKKDGEDFSIKVPFSRGTTLYLKLGNAVGYSSLIFTAIILVIKIITAYFRRRKDNRKINPV